MVYGDLGFFDIIVFAVVAVFLIYRLRSVLGKRTGHQKPPSPNKYTSEKIVEKINRSKAITINPIEIKTTNTKNKKKRRTH